MKRVILLVIFIHVLLIQGYCQVNGSGEKDTSHRNLLKDKEMNILIPWDSKDFSRLFDSTLNSQGFINSTPSIHGNDQFQFFDGSRFYDNMPYWKPKGEFKLRIYKPDTNTRYSILIKNL